MKHPSTIRVVSLLVALAAASTVSAAPQAPPIGARETAWSTYVANKWAETPGTMCVTEYRTKDNSRVDIVSDYTSFLGPCRIAWEVERAPKWKEAIGQAAFYQEETRSDQGGVVLLMLNDGDSKYLIRCALACKRCNLLLFVVMHDGSIQRVWPLPESVEVKLR